MLRVVVPTVYCRDPLEELFASPWSFHYGLPRPTPRAVSCFSRRRENSMMAYSTLAAFVEAMEAMNKSEQDCDKKCANCSCKKSTNQAADKPSQPNQEESTIPSTSNESVNSEQSSAASTSGDSGEAKSSEAVTVPIKKLANLSDSDQFQVSLNLKSFKPENIEVTRVDNELKVYAKEEVERYGMIFHREIRRSYQLPENIDVDSLKSTLSTAGVLTIEAKRRPKPSEEAEQEDKKGQDVNPELVEDQAEDSTTSDEKTEEVPAAERQEKTESSSLVGETTKETDAEEEEHTAEEKQADEQATDGQEE
ncbi:uncharacterized protein [Amphiura filiformis]|uniref:uncharacterized protein n=1 Tax=Amphiura filiformis TaxID=82378 RepID=UPI003B20EBB8